MRGFDRIIGRDHAFSKTKSDLYSPKHLCICGHVNACHGRRIGKCYAPELTTENGITYEGRCNCLCFQPVGVQVA